MRLSRGGSLRTFWHSRSPPLAPVAVRLRASLRRDAAYVIFDITAMAKSPDKPLVWLHGEVKTPPFTAEARVEVGFLLRRLQQGEVLGLPHSRPMPTVGGQCHELRINDVDATWRIVYRMDTDAVVILEVFRKKTSKTPTAIVRACKRKLKEYEDA